MIEGFLSFTGKDLAFDFNIRIDEEKATQKLICATFNTNSTYEPEVVYVISEVLKQGSIFADIGAHIGYHTLIARNMIGDSGKIYSVEANAENYRMLCDNVSINAYENIQCVNAIVSDVDGQGNLFINRDNDGGHSLWDCSQLNWNQATNKNRKMIMMPSITIDTLMDHFSIPHIDLIKIDTEGAELSILKGAKKALQDGKIRNAVLEIHEYGLKALGGSPGELFDFMLGFGYEQESLVPEDQMIGFVYNTWFRKV